MKKRLLIVFAVLGVLAVAASVIVPRTLPSALAFYRSDILFAVPTKDKKVFITIDDAPSKNTTEILSVLKKHRVPATFFIISDRVSTPTQLEEIVRGQHSLGNHLQTTKACSKLSQSEFQTSFDSCAALLQASTKPRFFRPASDFGTRQQIAYARARGYQAVVGTMFPMDHWISDPDWLVRLSSWLAVRGGILILHDGAIRGQTTAAVLERLIPKLKAAGFSFGRLEETEPNQALQPTAPSGRG
jgi:peptidoglycan/xylan/chitin deacetylase (PgdA/CDA1 family)